MSTWSGEAWCVCWKIEGRPFTRSTLSQKWVNECSCEWRITCSTNTEDRSASRVLPTSPVFHLPRHRTKSICHSRLASQLADCFNQPLDFVISRIACTTCTNEALGCQSESFYDRGCVEVAMR